MSKRKNKRIMDEVRAMMRLHRYSIRTERSFSNNVISAHEINWNLDKVLSYREYSIYK